MIKIKSTIFENMRFFTALPMTNILGFGKSLILPFLIMIFASCNSNNNESNKGSDDVSSHFFLLEKNDITSETIADIIDQANLKTGGYVLIIPTTSSKNNKATKNLKHKFNKQNILAVHSLNFHANSPIMNTDIIAIENASVICFLDGDTDTYIELANTTSLKSSFLKAKENGTVFVGIGNGASVIESFFD
jgi:hypothetical protein